MPKETSKEYVSQAKKVLKYLAKKGAQGATNYEMITKLHIIDVRKRISDLRWYVLPTSPFVIISQWEHKNKKHYLRYFLVKKRKSK